MAATDDRGEGADDALLVAYCDGALGPTERAALEARLDADPALAERLERIARGGEGIADAFATLLAAAPRRELDAMLDVALAQRASATAEIVPLPRRRAPALPFWRRPIAAAAVLFGVAILSGLLVGLIGLNLGETPRAAESWHQAVAEYWSLTTPETLALEPPDALADSQLALAGKALGMPLSRADLALEGPAFRGTQLYAFNGKPLVQIAYLDPDYGPIAFCLILNGAAAQTPDATAIGDFQIVRWSSGGIGRMVIGRAPAEVLERYAEALRERIG